MKTFLLILTILVSIGNKDFIEYKKGEKLSAYFPLDSIEKIELANWNGRKILNLLQQKSFTSDLKTYYCGGKYAHTKPGHLYGCIYFKNKIKLPFYSNTEAEIIIYNGSDDFTFISKNKVNFEKY
ncbi:MAG: hypothetical protein CFE24_04400 [Flavobacterium sp. BFFFF2]|nr:MAG: hypothetical protein CFE24_04400 [Flavobacterium sp. BFFFF2]